VLGVDGVVEAADVGGGEFACEIGRAARSWGNRRAWIGGLWDGVVWGK